MVDARMIILCLL